MSRPQRDMCWEVSMQLEDDIRSRIPRTKLYRNNKTLLSIRPEQFVRSKVQLVKHPQRRISYSSSQPSLSGPNASNPTSHMQRAAMISAQPNSPIPHPSPTTLLQPCLPTKPPPQSQTASSSAAQCGTSPPPPPPPQPPPQHSHQQP